MRVPIWVFFLDGVFYAPPGGCQSWITHAKHNNLITKRPGSFFRCFLEWFGSFFNESPGMWRNVIEDEKSDNLK